MPGLAGSCLIVDTDPRRREELARLARRASLSSLFAGLESKELDDILDAALPLSLAFIQVPVPEGKSLALLSRLCIGFPDCLLIAVDSADTADSAARSFAAGAHDVLRMPLRPEEAIARVNRGLSRLAPELAKRIEYAANRVVERLDLTQAEANVLRILSERQGQIVTRNELSQLLYGTPWVYGDRRFDVHITRIRRKLKGEFRDVLTLKTIRSVGYMLEYSQAG